MREEVVIVGAARTPIGSYGGALSQTPATTLGATAIKGEMKPVSHPETYLVNYSHDTKIKRYGHFTTRATSMGPFGKAHLREQVCNHPLWKHVTWDMF